MRHTPQLDSQFGMHHHETDDAVEQKNELFGLLDIQIEDWSVEDMQLECRAEDLRVAVTAIGRITGAVDSEDVLDIIFSDFCIGK